MEFRVSGFRVSWFKGLGFSGSGYRVRVILWRGSRLRAGGRGVVGHPPGQKVGSRAAPYAKSAPDTLKTLSTLNRRYILENWQRQSQVYTLNTLNPRTRITLNSPKHPEHPKP